MWKYLQGVSPPPPKKSKEDRKTTYDKQYEKSKRTRNFQPSWLTVYPWLKFDSSLGLMWCETCSANINTNSSQFCRRRDGGGCSTFKKETLVSHESSAAHGQSERVAKAKSQPKEMSEAGQMKLAMNKSQKDKI